MITQNKSKDIDYADEVLNILSRHLSLKDNNTMFKSKITKTKSILKTNDTVKENDRTKENNISTTNTKSNTIQHDNNKRFIKIGYRLSQRDQGNMAIGFICGVVFVFVTMLILQCLIL